MSEPEKAKRETVEVLRHGIKTILYNADPDCKHKIEPQWSGIKCVKCGGWFCI